jgi:hypothetical protein
MRQYGNGLIFGYFCQLMHVEFNQLPLDARIWVYAASSVLTSQQQEFLLREGTAFTAQWTAHQQPLKASFTIFHNLFLVFGVDTAQVDVSGCGIDKSVHLVQQWEKELGMPLFNRLQLEYLVGDVVHVLSKSQVVAAYENGTINDETLFFNKTVLTAEAFKKEFTVPFNKSWAHTLLPKQHA